MKLRVASVFCGLFCGLFFGCDAGPSLQVSTSSSECDPDVMVSGLDDGAALLQGGETVWLDGVEAVRLAASSAVAEQLSGEGATGL